MRVLVTGGAGMLGRALGEKLGSDADLIDLPDGDVTNPAHVRAAFDTFTPWIVVHAAAWTDVDGCERDPDRAMTVNGFGTELVAKVAAERRARLVVISTDYVFPGNLGRPLTEEDTPGPISSYGLSKLAGERAAILFHPAPLIIRTCGVYGPGGKHFPGAIARRIAAGEPLRVVDDQVVSPTYARDLAGVVTALIERPDLSGIYHVANAGATSWFEVARELAAILGRPDHPITAIASTELDRPAPRPSFSALDCGKLARECGIALRGWSDALRALHTEGGGFLA